MAENKDMKTKGNCMRILQKGAKVPRGCYS